MLHDAAHTTVVRRVPFFYKEARRSFVLRSIADRASKTILWSVCGTGFLAVSDQIEQFTPRGMLIDQMSEFIQRTNHARGSSVAKRLAAKHTEAIYYEVTRETRHSYRSIVIRLPRIADLPADSFATRPNSWERTCTRSPHLVLLV